MFKFPTIALAGAVCLGTVARGTEDKSSVTPPKERLVSPHVAALLAASLPKLEPIKPANNAIANTPAEAPKDEKAKDAVVVMAPFRVNESVRHERLLEEVTRQQTAVKPPAFTLKDGGTLFEKGPYELEFKYDAIHKGFDIFNLKF